MSENEIHRIVIENSNETHEDKETEGLCNVICILYAFILLINFDYYHLRINYSSIFIDTKMLT